MSIEGARRVMETTSADVVNQYLRFGWKLINQIALPATEDLPPRVQFTMASIRQLEDTRAVVTLSDPAAVNEHLRLGWKLIDTFVTQEPSPGRNESPRFVLAWQFDSEPSYPGQTPPHEHAAGEIDVGEWSGTAPPEVGGP